MFLPSTNRLQNPPVFPNVLENELKLRLEVYFCVYKGALNSNLCLLEEKKALFTWLLVEWQFIIGKVKGLMIFDDSFV